MTRTSIEPSAVTDALIAVGVRPGDTIMVHADAIVAAARELVRAPADGEGWPLDRLKALSESGVYTGIWWYADHPTHYRGDGRPATAEKGHRLLDAYAQALVRTVRLIKQDSETLRLQNEFFAASAGHA